MSGVSLRVLAEQKALWARVPDAGCKGLCQEACGPIGMTEVEAAVLIGAGRLRAEQLEPFGDGMWLLAGEDGGELYGPQREGWEIPPDPKGDSR